MSIRQASGRTDARFSTSNVGVPTVAVCLVAMAALSGTKRGLLVPGMRVSEILAIGLIFFLLLGGRMRLPNGRVAVGLACYALTTVSVMAFHMIGDASLGNATIVTAALGPLALFTMYVAASMARDVYDLLAHFVKYLMIASAAMGVLGLLQTASIDLVLRGTSYLTGSQRILEPLNWKVSRSIGLFNSWHAYASFMAITLVISIAVTASGLLVFRTMYRQLAAMLLILVGLLSSVTFAMIFLAGLIGGYILLRRGRVLLVALAAITAALLVGWSPLSPYFSGRIAEQESGVGSSILPQTVAFRIEIWNRDYLPLFYENILFGHGPIRADDSVFGYVESMYIDLLVTGGILLFAAFVFLLATIVFQLSPRLDPLDPDPKLYAAVRWGARLFTVSLIFAMLIHPYMRDAGAAQTLVIVSALAGSRFSGLSTSAGRSRERPRQKPFNGR
ncbi:hypothetical protein [Gordonia rubripertincta]|uniref:O-antigen ligase family protein n=1 Tax=Gordonia rubripertincta TaxID=36822 RepID=A0ABT4MXP5_GORRU|nr:hypothetical protein [Gordonia rubripertincta]MCZ4551794.1 hypothetical protein [Gordonia rubripertincta]